MNAKWEVLLQCRFSDLAHPGGVSQSKPRGRDHREPRLLHAWAGFTLSSGGVSRDARAT